MRKKWIKRLIIAVLLLFSAEAVARWGFGLGERLLYNEDPDCEYYMQPNQGVSRWGNTIQVNEYSLRSAPFKKDEFYRIMKIGDSVLNGGAHVDQDSLSSTRLEKKLTKIYPQGVRVYNASAGSWGPENAINFIEKKIDFPFQAMIMVFSSHDAHDNMHHKKVVGVHPAWPAQQPTLALIDAWFNGAWPKIKSWLGMGNYNYLKGFDDSAFNPGWRKTYKYCKKKNIPLLVYLHPEIKELKAGTLNENGQKIIRFLKKKNITYVTGIHELNQPEYYNDNIHLNDQGHQVMAQILLPFIEEMIETGKFPLTNDH